MMEKRSIDFLPQIDGLRFIAVFGVMINHWASQDFSNSFILSNIPFGTGVNLFYVISGFLITFILLKKKEEIAEQKTTLLREIKNFYVKRTLRIFPIYYLLIILLCYFSYDVVKEYLFYLLTYSVNWYMVLNNTFIGHCSHLWSLAVEEQFYLIWPFLIFFIPKRFTLWVILLSIIASIASKIYFSMGSYQMGINGATFSCFDSFGLGGLIAYFQINRQHGFKSTTYKTLLLISIILYIILFVNPILLNPYLKGLLFNFATSVVFYFVVAIAANGEFKGGAKAFLENKTVLYFGKISYGLYLYHNFAGTIYFAGINQYFPSLKGDPDLFIMFFFLTVVLATISWFLIERPILKLKKHF